MLGDDIHLTWNLSLTADMIALEALLMQYSKVRKCPGSRRCAAPAPFSAKWVAVDLGIIKIVNANIEVRVSHSTPASYEADSLPLLGVTKDPANTESLNTS